MDLLVIILFILTFVFLTEEDDDAEYDHLCHDSNKRIEGGERILHSEQNMGLVTIFTG